MVDQAVVERKLMLLAEYVQDLKEIQQVTFEEFMSDKRLRRYVERTLWMCGVRYSSIALDPL
ncbi:hypothetical protein SOV_42800 [Sporomusa ovata DSM 2662]|uniref:Uncharacterized protein n=1 Tax=Sporomusa ovata TaxID=2378 RepID=A0A0U1KTJ9_9FIRM|nr:hypothetical protein [Sporomusa ovata]EQB26668.1 hypothetical protein SOV_3c05420 [Sporomusa ovata DSM 2662]CQR70760.1 hypothetical protein SpAn4DRAFT_1738 [Sporomusa ovata]